MFSGTEATLILHGIVALAVTGAATDMLWGRIFNWLNLAGALAGLAVSAALGGWAAVGSSFAAIALAFALYGWLFWLGAMGGGDIKFLMALGAWGGWRYTVAVALLAVIVGGALALAAMTARGRIPGFISRMRRFALTLLVRELEFEPLEIERTSTIPFGVPIALAAIWVALGHPLAAFGVGV